MGCEVSEQWKRRKGGRGGGVVETRINVSMQRHVLGKDGWGNGAAIVSIQNNFISLKSTQHMKNCL